MLPSRLRGWLRPPTEAFEKPAKAIEKPSAAEGVARRAAGLIPDGVFGVQAALWLRRRLGAREVGHEEARWLGEAARRARDYALARALRGEAPEALREYLEEAGAGAWAVLSELAASPEAVRYASLLAGHLEDAYRGVLEAGFAQDAYRLFKPVIDAARRAEEELGAGDVVIRFADLFIAKFLKEAERAWERAYKAAATIEQALKAAAASAAGTAGLIATHDAVFSSLPAVAAAIALAKAGKYREAAEAARKAAEKIYEAARELWEAAKVTLERIIEIVVEAIARALDYVKAHWFIFAAAAAGLIAYSLAQQLDFQLWMEHVAKLAPVIVGAPKFKEFKLALEGEALLEAAERASAWRDYKSIKAFLDEGKKATSKMQGLKKVVEGVNKHRAAGEVVMPEHAVDVLALVEAGLKRLGKPPSLAEAAERLARGEEAPINEVVEYIRRTRDAAHQLRLLFKHIAENAERYAESPEEAKAIRKAFTITEAAEGLAEATYDEFKKLSGATLADKAVAFFESLARGTSWSRVVLNAMEKEKMYEALILAPATAAVRYGAGRRAGEAAEGGVERLEDLIARIAYELSKSEVGNIVLRRGEEAVDLTKWMPEAAGVQKGNQTVEVIKIFADGEEVAAVAADRIAEEKDTYRAWGRLVDEVGQQAQSRVERVERGDPGRFVEDDPRLLALLATDGGYTANGVLYAKTTSILQAAVYRRWGLNVKYAGYGDLTKEGLKPAMKGWLLPEEGGKKVVEKIRRYLEEDSAALYNNQQLREELRGKALDLLSRISITVHGVRKSPKEARRGAEEVRAIIERRIENFLKDLRLGEDGAVCLRGGVGCRLLTVEDEPYARVVASLLHFIASPNVSEHDVLRFFANVILFDGTVEPYDVHLTVGGFGAKSEEKQLPLDIYDKIALYLILAAKYGVGVKGIYVREGEAKIRLDRGYAARIFAAEWPFFTQMLREGKALGIGADHINKKHEKIRKYVEELAERIRIEHELREEKGKPKLVVRFKDGKGNELTHINVGWDGESLRAVFNGAKEKAERLASILSALGGVVEARQYGNKWRVELTTDSIAAIRRAEWLEAVKALVEALYKNGVISSAKRDELIKEIKAGPNVVEVAGVEMSVVEKKASGSKWLEITYWPTSAEAFEVAVNALRGAGFVEGVHFTAKRPEEGKKGYIYLKIPAGLWKLEELARRGVKWAVKAVSRLEEIAKARGFYDLLEEHLRPAKEAETIDPRGMIAEDKEGGVKAVIRNVKVMWEEGRPRIEVEYEAGGGVKSFSFAWRVEKDGSVMASVRLNYERAAVLAAVTGDETLKGRKGVVTLTAKDLFAMVRIKGVGWALLRWYAEVRGE
ncbi:PaRep2b protein [Pyrobaculum oguniense TE7]|uniref:PaRep2b protein n=1 Tax=Pyrobaculum oguniense (strain DSM 13380 / JCM 10595 / TE7) TaxID=698757 RepID=H6QC30_PYROT|nr:PaRep2b protein [Pyrobaculum oguniense TE7]